MCPRERTRGTRFAGTNTQTGDWVILYGYATMQVRVKLLRGRYENDMYKISTSDWRRKAFFALLRRRTIDANKF